MKQKTSLNQILLTVFLIFLTTNLFCQDSTLVKTYHLGGVKLKEEFYVLKDNQEIKHGLFMSFYNLYYEDVEQVKEIGDYKLGLRDNFWQKYSTKGKVVSSGLYLNGEKVGIWSFYLEGGLIRKSYDYDSSAELPIEIRIEEHIADFLINTQYRGELKYKVTFNESCEVTKIEIINGRRSEELESFLLATIQKKYKLIEKYQIENDDCNAGFVEEEFSLLRLDE